jgi:hypothetical protein
MARGKSHEGRRVRRTDGHHSRNRRRRDRPLCVWLVGAIRFWFDWFHYCVVCGCRDSDLAGPATEEGVTLIFYTDGDGQYDVRELHNLLACLKPNIDLVNGYKVKRADPWHRILIGAIYLRAMRWAFRLSIRDVDCDFRLFRRYIFETITLESRSGVICVEMAKKFEEAGFRMAEVPVSHYPRVHGRSEFFRVRHLAYTFKGLLKIWWALVILRRLPLWMSTAPKKF